MNISKNLPDVADEQSLFTISAVSEATGVPTVTLRAWERRYDFLTPHRTAKGHRLYSLEQIALIRRVTALIDSGIPVSRVGELIRQESMIAERPGAVNPESWQRAREEMLAAVRDFDEVRLDQIYEGLLSRFSDARVTEELIMPLLRQLGVSWKASNSGVAQEHFFSLYIRNKLGSRWHHGYRSVSGRRLVLACVEGDRHEYGLLFFALVARARGFDPVMLGADMPLAEIPDVAATTRASGIVLSSTIQPGWQLIERDLRKLVAEVAVPVFIGGSGVDQLIDSVANAGALAVGHELVPAVEKIHERIMKGA